MQKILPIYKGGRFYHSAYEKGQRIWAPSAFMYARSFVQRLFHKQKPSLSLTNTILPESGNYYVWLGHATFLIRLGDFTILTDPIFGDATWLFKRIMPPGMAIHQLPPIDYVLISHNHRDHMDEVSIRALVKQNPAIIFLVPQETRKWFVARGITRVHEYVWWDSYEYQGLKCTFLPSYHWSGRYGCDRNRSLWGSWMIECNGLTLYFAGDTAYWKHFLCIGHYFPVIDIAFLPIGPCKPFSYMQTSHLNAASAVQAFIDLRARHFVAMHWGTFYFGTDDIYTPLFYLERAWRNKRVAGPQALTIFKPGQWAYLDQMRTQVLENVTEDILR